ncbi:MAG: amidohydrolase family protein [Pseudonocardiaceae bacterium]
MSGGCIGPASGPSPVRTAESLLRNHTASCIRRSQDSWTVGSQPPRHSASATSIAAQVCGLSDRKGRLRAGYDADLLLVNGDPVNDVGVLSRPAEVMVHGRWAAWPSAAERTGLGQS